MVRTCYALMSLYRKCYGFLQTAANCQSFLRKFVIQLKVNNCSDTKLQITVLVATLYTAYIRSSLYLLPDLHLSSGLLAELTYWMMFLLFSK